VLLNYNSQNCRFFPIFPNRVAKSMLSHDEDQVCAVIWREDALELLDQRLLPMETRYRRLTDAAAVADAIREMVVRGAPAIGIAAAYGVVLAAGAHYARNPERWRESIHEDLQRLADSRPTAVNLFWALQRMVGVIAECTDEPVARLLAEAQAIHAEDIAANRWMGELGAAVLGERGAVLTHCNAGALATGGYGTALGVIRSGYAAGLIVVAGGAVDRLGVGAGSDSGHAAGGWRSGGADAAGSSALGDRRRGSHRGEWRCGEQDWHLWAGGRGSASWRPVDGGGTDLDG